MYKPIETEKAVRLRQSALIEVNIRRLHQALELLAKLDDKIYSTSPRGFAPHRVGAHIRHIVEFYQCFIDGLESLHIDYDSRRRDEAIEHSRAAASAAIRNVVQFFETAVLLRRDSTIWIGMEDAEGSDVEYRFMESSIGRELQVLSSHTIHHFALIAVTLRMHSFELDPEFGMAPSTLRYLTSKVEAA